MNSSTNPRPLLAAAAGGCAVVVALLAASAVLWDLILLFAPAAMPAERGGGGMAAVLGAMLRTTFLVGLAGVLGSRARAFHNPAEYGNDAVDRRALQDVVEQHREDDLSTSSEAGFYAEKSARDLLDIYQAIDRSVAPERFDELVLEMRRSCAGAPKV